MRNQRALKMVTGILLLGLVVATPSAAEDDRLSQAGPIGWTSRIVEGRGYSFDATEPINNEMVKQLAVDYGISEEAAASRYAWQLDFVDFVESIRSAAPDSFVDAEIMSHDSSPRAWIAFTGRPPEWIDAAIAELGLPIEVRHRRGALTEAEQERLVPEIHYEMNSISGVRIESTRVEPLAGEVRVAYYIEPSQRSRSSMKLLESARDLQARRSDMSIVLLESPVPQSVLDSNVRGGGQLRKKNGNGGCTTGFAATRNGHFGVLTAAHCVSDSRVYHNVINGAKYDLDGAHMTSPARGDIRWRRATTSITNFVHTHKTNHTTGVRINQTKGSVKKMDVMLFGRSSGSKSDVVFDLNVCYLDYCNVTAVSSYVSMGGDSGGPWRHGTAAVGIHSGRANIDGKLRSVYTRIGIANTDLSAVVRTTP